MISYFDAHCDTISYCLGAGDSLRRSRGHVDLERGRTFRRRGQFFALYHDAAKAPADGMWAQCLRLHDCFVRETEKNSDLVRHCRTGGQVDAAVAEGKVAALLSIEGADLIECDPERVETAATWGVKLINLTWNRHNTLSGTNREQPERGLSERGRDFVHALERCGIYADVSHLSDAGFWDLAEMAQRPIVASHSNARAVCGHSRNLTDDMFRVIRDMGGIVGLNFCPDFVDEEQPSLEMLVRHVEHFLELGGERTVCIGGDLDGCLPEASGIRGEQDVPLLYQALQARGYDESLLEDIFWNNLRKIL
ncbi:MAG: membrane dipeptidase [Ruminococcaceae bacterium]|jgi:membrane dipeptidase|nr:membrane dipeptidase [Oscillospiraceae bacterium]